MEAYVSEPALGYSVHAEILKYLDLKTIFTKMSPLSRDYNAFVKSENYTLYKRFLQLFCLNHNKKRDGLAAECDIVQLIQDCCTLKAAQSEEYIKCYSFYTDGGAYQDSNTYFLYRLQGDGNTLHSTVKIEDMTEKGVNIQVYVGREAEYDPATMKPRDYRVVNDVNLRIRLPIESRLVDPAEEETFKMITQMTIDKHTTGYTCFVHTFAIFVSDKEIDCEKSNVLQAFAGVDSIQKFLDMGLDVAQYTQPSSGSKEDLSELKEDTQESTVFEIDLSRPKKLQQAMKEASGLNLYNFDCYPLFWCQQEKISLKWAIRLKQRVACKYFVIKLLSRAPGSSAYDANLDMYPLEFHGYKMPIPKTISELENPTNHNSQIDSFSGFNMINTHDEILRLTGTPLTVHQPIRLHAADVGHSIASDEPQLLFVGAQVDFYPKQVKVAATWSDQGWGNKKARLHLRLYRAETLVCDQDVFGVFDRGSTDQTKREFTTADNIVKQCSPGDWYKIYGVSGGGGGHSINVQKVEVFINPKMNDSRTPQTVSKDFEDVATGNLFADDDEY